MGVLQTERDALPRVKNIRVILRGLTIISEGATFRQLRTRLATPRGGSVNGWTIARACLEELRRLELIIPQEIPRRVNDSSRYESTAYSPTDTGRELVSLYATAPGAAVDQIFQGWWKVHPVYRKTMELLANPEGGRIYVPEIPPLRRVVPAHALDLALEHGFMLIQKAFGEQISARYAEFANDDSPDFEEVDTKQKLRLQLGRLCFSVALRSQGLSCDERSWRAFIQLTGEEYMTVTFSNHPEYPGMVTYSTAAIDDKGMFKRRTAHAVALDFLPTLCSEYDQLHRKIRSPYVNYYQLRAKVCLELGIHRKVCDILVERHIQTRAAPRISLDVISRGLPRGEIPFVLGGVCRGIIRLD